MKVILEIINEKGLHARASAKLVELVEDHNANAKISKDGITVSGDSIMGLLMLSASKGSKIEVQTTGIEKKKLILEIKNLIMNKFGEQD